MKRYLLLLLLVLGCGQAGCGQAEPKSALDHVSQRLGLYAELVKLYGKDDERTRRIAEALITLSVWARAGFPPNAEGLCEARELIQTTSEELAGLGIPTPGEMLWVLENAGRICPK
jgi:hypothetical protein